MFLIYGKMSTFLIVSISLLLTISPLQAKELRDPFKPQQIVVALTKDESREELVTLHFQKTSLRAILTSFAKYSKKNIVVSEQVTGEISLNLTALPWRHAFTVILKTNHLSMQDLGGIIFIKPEIEEFKERKEALLAEQEVENLLPLESLLIQINYAKATDLANLLHDKNNSLLSTRGSVSVDVRTNSLWLHDDKRRLMMLTSFLKRLDVPVKQVLIEARIVNVTKECLQTIGARLGFTRLRQINDLFAGEISSSWLKSSPVDRLRLDLATNILIANPTTTGIALAKLGNGILLDLELSALESEGQGEVIANPRLITANQQPALIESGEEIPYQESAGSGATSIAFRKAVLSLKVTPQVTPDSNVYLALQITQDMPSAQLINGVPSIMTKEILTNVIIHDGETVVLGGIDKQNKNHMTSRIPLLGQLPVVGNLFRNRAETIKNEELLIFITPRIISDNKFNNDDLKNSKSFAKGVELDKFGKPIYLESVGNKRRESKN